MPLEGTSYISGDLMKPWDLTTKFQELQGSEEQVEWHPEDVISKITEKVTHCP